MMEYWTSGWKRLENIFYSSKPITTILHYYNTPMEAKPLISN
jgi:hypothetical protein